MYFITAATGCRMIGNKCTRYKDIEEELEIIDLSTVTKSSLKKRLEHLEDVTENLILKLLYQYD
jgi:hypothetical protein